MGEQANFYINNCGWNDLVLLDCVQSGGTVMVQTIRSAFESPRWRFEMINKIEIERFSLTSSKPFDQVVAAVDSGIGHPDMAEFGRSTHQARSFAELKSAVEKGLSEVGLMLFMKLDQGAVVRKESGQNTPRIIRLLIGNPLIMKEMAKHVPDAGSYAPVTVLVDERPDGVHLSYDRMSSFLAPYGNRDALQVAQDLDKKVENLLRQAAN